MQLLFFNGTDRCFETDGVGRGEQACSEGGEVFGATNGSAGGGFGQRHHAVCAPLLLALAEVLTQRGEQADLQLNAHRPRALAAARADVDEVIQSGVVRPAWHRTDD